MAEAVVAIAVVVAVAGDIAVAGRLPVNLPVAAWATYFVTANLEKHD